jgi:outer membrane cobalamin receptor
MRKFYTLLLLTFFVFIVSRAQTISGIISDHTTSEKLIGVNIITKDGKGTATDIFGKYILKLEAGNHQITYRYIGYKDVIKDITLKNGEQKTIDIKLKTANEQLSTVVVSAGKFEQNLEEITVSMEVLKPSLIENKNTTDIQTALDQVPGVNITDGQANIRGGSGWSYGAGSRVLVMVDDMPLISGDAGQVQWKLIATENINQIEIIKGASSVLYGSSALNGVINIRTAFPTQKDIDKSTTSLVSRVLPGYTKVNMHFGLIDKPKREELNWNGDKRRAFKGIDFFHAMKLKNLDLSLGGNIFKDDGYRKGEVTDRKRFNFGLKYKNRKIEGLSYGINGNFLFQATGSVLIWKSLQEAYTPLGDEITTTSGDTYNIDPFVTYMHGNSRHSLRTRYLKVINDNSTKGKDDGQDNESEIYYTDYQWQKNIDKYNLRITSGITNEIVYARSELFQGNNSRKNHSLYTQLDKKWNKLNISLGARYEYFSIDSEKDHVVDGDTINHIASGKPVFRTGLNYQIAEYTYIRSSWGQGYRFPSMAELFISTNQSGLEIYPNPDLKPESGWSTEIGIKQAVRLGNWMGYLDVAAFLMQYDDMMEFSFGWWGSLADPMNGIGFKSVNVGKTQISGIEFSVNGQGKINNNLTINVLAGYTYMNSKSLEPDKIYAYGYYHGYTLGDGSIADQSYTYRNSSVNDKVLKYRYKHIAKLDAEVVYKKISLGGSFRYNDFMQNMDWIFSTTLINGNYTDNPLRDDPSTWIGGTGSHDTEIGMIPGINTAREKFKGGDFIVDIRTAYQINKNIRLGVIINNLLNREYMSRPANMMPQRTYAMQLSMKI